MLDNLSFTNPVSLLAAAAVLVFVVGRQFLAQRVQPARMFVVPGLLLFFAARDAGGVQFDAAQGVLLAAGVASGAVLGALRGLTYRVWSGLTGETWMQGTWLTLVLWAGLFAVRIAAGALGHAAGGSVQTMTLEVLLTMAFNFGAQNAVIWLRRPQPVLAGRV